MSALPEQVQRQQAEVDAIEATLAQPAAPSGDPPTPPASEPAPAPAPQPPAPPAQPSPPAPAPEPTDWEHRYRTLQGMIVSQTRDLNAQIQAKDGQIQALQTQVEQLLEASKKAPEPPKPAAVSQEDTEKFGPEIIDLIGRKAAEVAEQQMGPLKQELEATKAENASLKKQVEGVAGNQAQSQLHEYKQELTSLCPTWEKVNVDQAFGNWLQVVEPLAGVTRQALLTDAYSKRDASRTATIFNQYLQEVAAAPAPQPQPQPSQPSLESLQAPGNSRQDTPPANPAAEKIWSQAEIDAFFAQVRRRELTPEEATRIEAEIDAAVAAGRVR